MVKLTDRELVDRARDHADDAAFGELVRRHQQRIFRLALHMVKNRAEAEDLMQETFIRAHRAIGRFDGRCEPYTWFYRIAVNLSLNAIRTKRTRPTRSTTEDSVADARLDALMVEKRSGYEANPSGQLTRKEQYIALCEAIDSLSDLLRTTLILVCIDGRSHLEVAEIFGVSEGTISWRVHEARRKLRDFMQARGLSPEGY